MRFVLDEDVDQRCVKVLMEAGHDCWTIPAAGMSGSPDTEVLAYAEKKAAVLVTTDRLFAQSCARREFLGTCVVFMDCQDYMAPDYLAAQLDEVLWCLRCAPRHVPKVVRTRAESVTIIAPPHLQSAKPPGQGAL